MFVVSLSLLFNSMVPREYTMPEASDSVVASNANIRYVQKYGVNNTHTYKRSIYIYHSVTSKIVHVIFCANKKKYQSFPEV